MSQAEQSRQEIILILLDLSVVPISPDALSKNFDVDPVRAERELEALVDLGDVRCVDDQFYELASKGERRVTTRSPAD